MSGAAGLADASGTDSAMMAAPVLREPGAEMFTPSKVAGVASVSNMSEILPSRLALQRSRRADVRAYAQEMIAMHTRLEQQMQAMLKAKGLTAEHNGYSYQVQSNLRPMLQQLAAPTRATSTGST
jgi:putative membrane protein